MQKRMIQMDLYSDTGFWIRVDKINRNIFKENRLCVSRLLLEQITELSDVKASRLNGEGEEKKEKKSKPNNRADLAPSSFIQMNGDFFQRKEEAFFYFQSDLDI